METNGIPFNGKAVKVQGQILYSMSQLNFSDGWFAYFKKRGGYTAHNCHGAAGSIPLTEEQVQRKNQGNQEEVERRG